MSILTRLKHWIAAGNMQAALEQDPHYRAGEQLRRENLARGVGNRLGVVDGDGWLTLLTFPAEIPHRTAGLQVVTEQDVDLMLAEFAEARRQAGNSWAGRCVFIGHPEDQGPHSDDTAYGWFKELRKAGNQLQARAEWTEDGQALVQRRAFKFYSPYWYGIRDGAGNFRPRVLGSIGLTNFPNIPNLEPLANRAENPAPEVPQDDPTEPTDEPSMAAEMLAALDAQVYPDEAGNAASQVVEPWWQAFSGRLAVALQAATTPEMAREIIERHTEQLYDQARQLRELAEQIQATHDPALAEIRAALGKTLMDEGAPSPDLVPAWNAMVDALARERRAFAAHLVDTWTERGLIQTGNRRDQIVSAVAANRRLWQDQVRAAADARQRPAIPADPTATLQAGNSTLPVPGSCGGGVSVSIGELTTRVQERIATLRAGNSRLSYNAAHNLAFAQITAELQGVGN